MRASAFALGLTFLLVALSATASARPAHTVQLPGVNCKLAGTHYRGTTSQHQKVCLTVSSNGKGIRQYAFGARFACGAQTLPGLVFVEGEGYLISVGGVVSFGSAEGTAKATANVGRNGTFKDTITVVGADTSTFKGKIAKTKASGTLAAYYVANATDPFERVDCVAKATWNAPRR